MTPQDRAALVAQLIDHEGLRLKPYTDTVGKLTIGCGRNLNDRGISKRTALDMLDEDIDLSVQELTTAFGWFAGLDAIRQRVLIDMHINLGLFRLRQFRKMLAAIGQQNYADAAREMKNSKWAQQVGRRAVTLAGMMEHGEGDNLPEAA